VIFEDGEGAGDSVFAQYGRYGVRMFKVVEAGFERAVRQQKRRDADKENKEWKTELK
jgi:hypothetical protein